MKSSIFIPSKICVGYCNREDTYTKKLAYVVYYDNRNKRRKETSFESWRDKKIPIDDFENIPTSGFVLNKNVDGYKVDWNMRKSYIRVYDPRGFEFEIGLENLLYILENASSFKGKGLEGEFVYGWDGKDLVLIPTESPDYDAIKNFQHVSCFGCEYIGESLISGDHCEGCHNFLNYKKKDVKLMSKNEPDFPGVELNGNGSPYQAFLGMTKREFFALEILKGLLSNPNISKMNNDEYCGISIVLADYLLGKLENEK